MFEELRATYQGKKVFLTGHTGFKGSWMLLLLKMLGAEVKGYALAPDTEESLYQYLDGDSLCDSVIADIRDQQRLEKEIADFDPDYVFHLAAQALVIDSYIEPVYTYEVNVLGTINVLEAIRKRNSPCKAIIITTDKVYENLERAEPYAESDRLGGFDPYSNSKACAELATGSYRSSFFHPDKIDEHQISVSTARSGNVIGGGDWSANRIIPDMVKAFAKGEKLQVRNPNAVRPWQHVLDPLYGYLLLGVRMSEDNRRYNDAFNFGPHPDDELNVRELVEIAVKAWGSGGYESPQLENQPHEAGLLKLAIDKAQSELNWAPRFTAKEAIETTVSWYANFNNNARELCEQQIRQFFSNEG